MGKADKNSENRAMPREFRDSPVFPVAVVKNSGTFDHYYDDMLACYEEARQNFLASDVRNPEIVRRSGEWEKAARVMIMANAALFGLRKGNIEDRQKALDGLEQCKKDSGIRADSLKYHYELAKQAENPDPGHLRKLLNIRIESLKFYFRAVVTQQAYGKIFVSDPNYMTPELRAEKRLGAKVAKIMSLVPRDHMFLPARPFPPARVPEGEPVPWLPEAYEAWKSLPIEDFRYDTEHDEFVLPEGYVSEDGRIDDQSVVWNWSENTVTIKFRGGDSVTWPFWKAKDMKDNMEEGSWCADYYIRLYEQTLADLDPPGSHD